MLKKKLKAFEVKYTNCKRDIETIKVENDKLKEANIADKVKIGELREQTSSVEDKNRKLDEAKKALEEENNELEVRRDDCDFKAKNKGGLKIHLKATHAMQ